jgi:hypothetical protein
MSLESAMYCLKKAKEFQAAVDKEFCGTVFKDAIEIAILDLINDVPDYCTAFRIEEYLRERG